MRLINANVSLRKIGFLYSHPGRWRLAPATGLRPAMEPERQPASSRTGHGRRCDVDQLLRLSAAFETPHDEARRLLKAMDFSVARSTAFAQNSRRCAGGDR